jgi:hypothetical protein
MKSKSFILIILATIPFLISAKLDPCIDFHKCMACRALSAKDFQLHGLSRSALLEIGVPSNFDIVLYGGKDFVVTSCSNRMYYPIHMRLFAENREILYDNQMDDYMESVGFSLDTTSTITIELTLLAERVSEQDFDENRSCAGVNILWRMTPKIGF